MDVSSFLCGTPAAQDVALMLLTAELSQKYLRSSNAEGHDPTLGKSLAVEYWLTCRNRQPTSLYQFHTVQSCRIKPLRLLCKMTSCLGCIKCMDLQKPTMETI